jgi:hypothetical protein
LLCIHLLNCVGCYTDKQIERDIGGWHAAFFCSLHDMSVLAQAPFLLATIPLVLCRAPTTYLARVAHLLSLRQGDVLGSSSLIVCAACDTPGGNSAVAIVAGRLRPVTTTTMPGVEAYRVFWPMRAAPDPADFASVRRHVHNLTAVLDHLRRACRTTDGAAVVDVDVETRRLIALVSRVQRTWRRAITDPAYRVCRARLTRECAEMRAEMDEQVSSQSAPATR